jgi:putative FmdB family regulatory protein
MPSYDYVCQDCGKPFEIQVSVAEYSKGIKPGCPNCGSPKAIRTFTSVTVLTSRGGSSGPAACGPSFGPGCCR